MKNSHLLVIFAILSLAAAGARPSTLDANTESIRLPAYTVTVPRQNAAERQVTRSLDALRATARTPLPVKTEIPLLHARSDSRRPGTKPTPVLIVAKA